MVSPCSIAFCGMIQGRRSQGVFTIPSGHFLKLSLVIYKEKSHKLDISIYSILSIFTFLIQNFKCIKLHVCFLNNRFKRNPTVALCFGYNQYCCSTAPSNRYNEYPPDCVTTVLLTRYLK